MQVHWEQQDWRLQEAAGFGHSGLAEGWSWRCPLSLAGFVQEMNKKVGILVMVLERSQCPGLCAPGRTHSHCDTGQNPWEDPNTHLPSESVTLSLCGGAEAPAGRCPQLPPVRGCWTTLRWERGLSVIPLPLADAVAAFPCCRPGPVQCTLCHLKSYLMLFIIWSLFFH